MARVALIVAAVWLRTSLDCTARAAAAHQCHHAVVVSGSPKQLAWAASACLEATEINVAALNSRHELELLRSAELLYIGDRAKTLPVAFLANRNTSTWLLTPPLATSDDASFLASLGFSPSCDATVLEAMGAGVPGWSCWLRDGACDSGLASPQHAQIAAPLDSSVVAAAATRVGFGAVVHPAVKLPGSLLAALPLAYRLVVDNANEYVIAVRESDAISLDLGEVRQSSCLLTCGTPRAAI